MQESKNSAWLPQTPLSFLSSSTLLSFSFAWTKTINDYPDRSRALSAARPDFDGRAYKHFVVDKLFATLFWNRTSKQAKPKQIEFGSGEGERSS